MRGERKNARGSLAKTRFKENCDYNIYSEDEEVRASDYELQSTRQEKTGSKSFYEDKQNDAYAAFDELGSKKKTLPKTLRLAFSKSVGNLKGLWSDMADHWKTKSGRDSQDLKKKETCLNVLIATWNMNGQVPGANLDQMLGRTMGAENAVDSDSLYHIIAVGTQECARSIEQSVLLPSKEEWEQELKSYLKDSYEMILAETMTAIHLAVFIHKTMVNFASGIKCSKVATGLGNVLGNKGGIGASLKLGQHSLLFVNAHFTAHQNAVLARNHDFHRINQELALTGYSPSDALEPLATDRFDYVFWFGDLNYRVNGTRRMVDALIQKNEMDVLLGNDQLSLERKRGTVFRDFSESSISFLPTYKVDFNKKAISKKGRNLSFGAKKTLGDSGTGEAVVALVSLETDQQSLPRIIYDTSSKARIPAWTDRILYKARLRVEGHEVPQDGNLPVFTMHNKKHRQLACSIFPDNSVNQDLPPLPPKLNFVPKSDREITQTSPCENGVVLSITNVSANDACPLPKGEQKKRATPILREPMGVRIRQWCAQKVSRVKVAPRKVESAHSTDKLAGSNPLESSDEKLALKSQDFDSLRTDVAGCPNIMCDHLHQPITVADPISHTSSDKSLSKASLNFANQGGRTIISLTKKNVNNSASRKRGGGAFSAGTQVMVSPQRNNGSATLNNRADIPRQKRTFPNPSSIANIGDCKRVIPAVEGEKDKAGRPVNVVNPVETTKKLLPGSKNLPQIPLNPQKLTRQLARNDRAIQSIIYKSLPAMRYSDHLPVVGVFQLPEVLVEKLQLQYHQTKLQKNKRGFFQNIKMLFSGNKATCKVQ